MMVDAGDGEMVLYLSHYVAYLYITSFPLILLLVSHQGSREDEK